MTAFVATTLKTSGWVKIKTDSIKDISEVEIELMRNLILNNQIKQLFQTHKIININDLREKAKNLSDEIINTIRKVYINNLNKKMLNSFSYNIKNIFGSNLCAQRYPQIQLNIAEKPSTQTPAHTEVMAGHSPFTFNLWVPFHNTEQQSGIFIIDSDKSVELCDYELSNQTKCRWDIIKDHIHFPQVRYGEALLFNSFVYHGTINHSAKKARISADVRFQSLDKPLYQKFNEFFEKVTL